MTKNIGEDLKDILEYCLVDMHACRAEECELSRQNARLIPEIKALIKSVCEEAIGQPTPMPQIRTTKMASSIATQYNLRVRQHKALQELLRSDDEA